MHGIIHAELRKFVVANYDDATWQAVLTEAKLPGQDVHAARHLS